MLSSGYFEFIEDNKWRHICGEERIKKAQSPMVFVLDGDKRLEWSRSFGLFRSEKKMNKKKWIRIVSIYSIIYTVITLLNSVLYLRNGIYEDPSGNWHELDRAMILLIGIAAFELCTNLPVKPLALRYLIAYIPSQLLAFAYVWFSGLREPLAKTAYRDIWINFTSLFVLLCIINTVIYVFKKKRGQKGEKK